MIAQQVLRTADRVAGAFSLLDRDLDGAGLLDFAQRRCRLHGFGDDAVTAPLQVLLQSYSREASLSLVGRAAARWDVQQFLSNLARMAEEEAARPAYATSPSRPLSSSPGCTDGRGSGSLPDGTRVVHVQ